MLQTTPPFDPYSEAFFGDPFSTYQWMRDTAPVYHNEKYDFYALSRHRDVAAALKDVDTFSSAAGVDLASIRADESPYAASVITTDPPDHRRLRGLINNLFTPRAIESRRQLVAEEIHSCLAALDRDEFDVVTDFSAPFPVGVITRMLGVPDEHRALVRHCVDVSLHREPGRIEMTEAGTRAVTTVMTLYGGLVGQKRAQPGDDMISALVHTGLSDPEIVMFALTLGGAGAETVTKLIGTAAVTFWRHPDQWRKLRDDRSKIPAAVEELLRYEGPSQYLVRVARRGVHLHGTTIPAGSPVFLLLGAANRDPEAFNEPDAFDIDRQQSHALGLGYGIHSCLGAALARLESAMALEALLDFMPRYEVIEAGLTRVSQINVCGWQNVPVRILH